MNQINDDRPIRLGVIGLGQQGQFYAGLVKDGRAPSVRLAAVCSANPNSRSRDAHQRIADELGVPLFTDYSALLDSGSVDAVVITTPHYEHPAMGIEALGRGVHVLLEKPAGIYTRQATELFDYAATKPELTLAMMFNQRANPLYADLKSLIESGSLGALRQTSWLITSWWRPDAYYASSAWRATWGGEGGGVLVNQAPHQLDLWQWLCGVPKRCFARVQYGFRRDIPVEDEVNANVDFGNGVTGTFITSTNDLVGTDRLEMRFDRGKVVVEDSKKVTIWTYQDDERTIARELSPEDAYLVPSGAFDRSTFFTSQTKEYVSEWGQQHSMVIENFGQHILHQTPLIAPGSEGIHNVRLANAMHLSSWLGTDVEIADFDEDLYLTELNRRIEAEGTCPIRS